jgi:hypothetical protein
LVNPSWVFVILKIKWRSVLRIIWRTQPQSGGAFGWRVRQTTDERSLAKCPTIRDNNAKPDGMIDGRESGLALSHVAGQAGSANYRSKIAAT